MSELDYEEEITIIKTVPSKINVEPECIILEDSIVENKFKEASGDESYDMNKIINSESNDALKTSLNKNLKVSEEIVCGSLKGCARESLKNSIDEVVEDIVNEVSSSSSNQRLTETSCDLLINKKTKNQCEYCEHLGSHSSEIQSDWCNSIHLELSDVEDGEITDNSAEINNPSIRCLVQSDTGNPINCSNSKSCYQPPICKYYANGTCRFGFLCQFMHVTSNSNFGENYFAGNFSGTAHQLTSHAPHPLLNQATIYEDSWERGLHEAKKMILAAKEKKEKDFKFEEKKLYLSLKHDKIEKLTSVPRAINVNSSTKHSKPSDSLPKSKNARSKTKTQPIYTPKCAQNWTDPWRRSRSRIRNKSPSDSSLSTSSEHCGGSCSSYCSLCSNEEDALSEKRFPKSLSKLDRVYARTFSESRSSKRQRSKSLSPPYLQRFSNQLRPKKRTRRILSRSSSNSNNHTRKHSKEKDAHKKSVKNNEKQGLKSGISESLKHAEKSSFKTDWGSFGSDMTISSLTCTTYSGSNSPVSDPKDIVSNAHDSNLKMSFSNDENHLMRYQKCEMSNYDKKCIEKSVSPEKSVSKSYSETGKTNQVCKNAFQPSDKIVLLKLDDQVQKCPVNDKAKHSNSEKSNVLNTCSKISFSISNNQNAKNSVAKRIIQFNSNNRDRKQQSFNKLDAVSNSHPLDKNQGSSFKAADPDSDNNPPIKKKRVITSEEMELLKYFDGCSCPPPPPVRSVPVPLKPNKSSISEAKIEQEASSSDYVEAKHLKGEVSPSELSKSKHAKKKSQKAPTTLSRREILLRQLRAVELAIAKRKNLNLEK